jgi:hypothetical protein
LPDVACEVELVELVAVPVAVVLELEELGADELVAAGAGLDAGADEVEDGGVEEGPL